MKNTVYAIDTEAVKRSFSQAADHYDHHAELQRTVIEDAFTLLQPYVADDAAVLDVGCGTGYLAKYTSHQSVNWNIIQCDIAEGMTYQAAPHAQWTVCGDAAFLPFREDMCDAVFCSLCLQWIQHPISVFEEFARLLPQDAHLLITSFSPESMKELRNIVMEKNIPLKLHPFSSSDVLLPQMNSSGFDLIDHHEKQHIIYFHNFKSMRSYFNGLGANIKANSQLSLSSKRNIMEKIEHAFNIYNGHIPLTFYMDYYLLKRC